MLGMTVMCPNSQNYISPLNACIYRGSYLAQLVSYTDRYTD